MVTLVSKLCKYAKLKQMSRQWKCFKHPSNTNLLCISQSSVRSEGIAIFIKEELSPVVGVCDKTIELLFWTKIRHDTGNFTDSLLASFITPLKAEDMHVLKI